MSKRERRDTSKYDSITYEWRRNRFAVHGWGTYPRYSVLAGQPMKVFLDSFYTEREVNIMYPEAKASHILMQPEVNFNHLPDDADY